MRRTAAVFFVVLALVGLVSCAKYKFGTLAEQETVVVPLRYDPDTKTCKLAQRTPPEIRTRPGREVTWIIESGVCEGHKIAIDTRRGGKQDLFDGPGLFEGSVPAKGQLPLRFTSRLRGGLAKGHYRYRLLIDGANAQYNPEADEGSMFLCPEWPCGGFKDY